MPLLDTDSPDMGAAFQPEFSQQRMKMLLPGINPSTVGAANPSCSQPQRREIPLPETLKLAPPKRLSHRSARRVDSQRPIANRSVVCRHASHR